MAGDLRQVTAICQFRGGPGREQEAAEAWAFELTYYFLRGVGEAPQVTYEDGIYTCTGLMQATHPGDDGDLVEFDKGEPWDLDFCTGTDRRKRLQELYPACETGFDGRTA